MSAVSWEEEIAFSTPQGGFTVPEPLPHTGALSGVAIDAEGDASVLMRTDAGDFTSFRPAGGSFGAAIPVDLARGTTALVLTDEQETILAGAKAIVSRSGDGPLSAPFAVTSAGTRTQLTADARGRVLAATSVPDGIDTTVRAAGGDWSDPVFTAVPRGAVNQTTTAGAGGDVVIAWRDYPNAGRRTRMGGNANGGAVRALTGTTADAHLSGPILLDGATSGYFVSAATAPDGSAAVIYQSEGAGRLVRRSGSGPFGAPQGSSCLAGTADALLPDGRLILNGGVAWNEPGRSLPSPNCMHAPTLAPQPVVTPVRVYVGDPVAIDASPLRQADWPIESVDVAWTDGAVALAPQPGDPATLIRHAFPRPGSVAVDLVLHQHRPEGCCSVDRAAVVSVPVLSHAALRIPAQSAAAVRRHGLSVSVAAETTGLARPVTVRVRRRGRLVGRRTFNALAVPRTVRVPLRRRTRGSVRVTLGQGGRRVAKPVEVTL